MPNKVKFERSISLSLTVALIIGVIAMEGISGLSILINLEGGIFIALISFLIMGWLLEVISPPDTSILMLLLIACGGIIVVAAYVASLVWFLLSLEPNLREAKALVWWLFAPLPLAVGMIVARQYEMGHGRRSTLPDKRDTQFLRVTNNKASF